jgi:hypothetical protein
MSWINVGSPQYKDIHEMKFLNAYMFWIGADCNSMTPARAKEKFPKELWNVGSELWVRKCILTQDPKGLDEMRKEYTRRTGKEWMNASLSEVKSTLRYCIDLYEQGKVLINGMSLISSGLIKEGQAKKVVEEI